MSLSIVIVSNELPPEGLQLHEPQDFTIHWYVSLDAGDPEDYQEILDLCRRKRAVAVLAGAASLLPLIAWIAESLGLPGPSVQLAQLMNDRGLLLERLRICGIPTVPFRIASSESEAIRSAHALGEPVIVQAVEGVEGARSRYVQYMPEVGLAYRQVTQKAGSKRALVTRPVGAGRQSAYYFVHKATVRLGGLFRVAVEPRFMFPVVVSGPIDANEEVAQTLTDLGNRVSQAIRFMTGVLRLDVLQTSIGLQVTGADMCPISNWMPVDLADLAGATRIFDTALQLAAGQELPAAAAPHRGAAIAWYRANTGHVVSVDGLDTASAMEGVALAAARIEPDDVIRHVVDQAGRDRLGFVAATGPDVPTAEARAKSAAAAVQIRTQIALDGTGSAP